MFTYPPSTNIQNLFSKSSIQDRTFSIENLVSGGFISFPLFPTVRSVVQRLNSFVLYFVRNRGSVTGLDSDIHTYYTLGEEMGRGARVLLCLAQKGRELKNEWCEIWVAYYLWQTHVTFRCVDRPHTHTHTIERTFWSCEKVYSQEHRGITCREDH